MSACVAPGPWSNSVSGAAEFSTGATVSEIQAETVNSPASDSSPVGSSGSLTRSVSLCSADSEPSLASPEEFDPASSAAPCVVEVSFRSLESATAEFSSSKSDWGFFSARRKCASNRDSSSTVPSRLFDESNGCESAGKERTKGSIGMCVIVLISC